MISLKASTRIVWSLLLFPCVIFSLILIFDFQSVNFRESKKLQRLKKNVPQEDYILPLGIKNEIGWMFRDVQSDVEGKIRSNETALNDHPDFYFRRNKLVLRQRGYTLSNCACVRFGFDLSDIQENRERAKDRPWDYPSWFLKRFSHTARSTCSEYATQRGIGQNVISYSYYNVNKTTDKRNLAEKQSIGRLWRFAVMGDFTVNTFLVRDTDSYVLNREVVAVNQWLRSGKGFLVLRDHPNHKAVMLAGLWGGWNKIPKQMEKIRDEMFVRPQNYSRTFDQYLLATLLWPVIRNDVLQYDSYNCEMESHSGSLPYPVRRYDWYYCGWGPYKIKERRAVIMKKCPLACRPKDHQNWEWC